jgi:hypothetical protein
MESTAKYYVYAYLRVDNSIYYIGKGTGRRYLHTKNDRVHPPTDRTKIKFLAINLFEHEALLLERLLIAKFGRKDIGTGILRNTTDGGWGTSGFKLSAASKLKLSNSVTQSHTRKDVKEKHRAAIIKSFECPQIKEKHRLACIEAQNRPSVKALHWKSALTRQTRTAIKHNRASIWPK